MDRTRRSILKAGAGTALALAAGRVAAGDCGPRTLLILGGTGCIGPHLTAARSRAAGASRISTAGAATRRSPTSRR